MASLSEHRDAILAAINAAKEEGYSVQLDVQYGTSSDLVELDIWGPNSEWLNILKESF